MNRNLLELAVAGAVGAISVAALLEGMTYRGQASYLPVAISVFALLMSLIWAGQSLRGLLAGTGAQIRPDLRDTLSFAGMLVVAALFVSGVTRFGFVTSSLVMVPVMSLLMGYRNLPAIGIGTVLFCLLLHGVFSMLLSIPLPHDVLLGAMGMS
ncbi:MAG: tripartite tricarboxylate transporter TctB family protein [Paracoccus sp. (in: a-proteobacteria)]|nr:tripartite tricarboxylate transporter TctB family protein [Paracoccus sp. (in: a-proteobacteria)]